MQIPKPTEQDKAGFRSMIPADPAVVIKPMFGNLGAFVNGNMFAGLFGSTIGVRLVDDASRRELEAVEGSGPFGPVERPMRRLCRVTGGLGRAAGTVRAVDRGCHVPGSGVAAQGSETQGGQEIPLIHWSGTA